MLKGAVIGFGKIALTGHLPAFNSERFKDRILITSIVEPLHQIRQKGKQNFPDISFYNDIDELLQNEHPDFVDISCPPEYHYDILKKVIKKDVHIICEKPFTLTTEQAKEIYDCVILTGNVFMPCHQYKYSPVWKSFKNFLDNNINGSRVLIYFDVFRTEADRGIEQRSNSWRTGNSSSGGGILADTGIHYLYLSSWLLGKFSKISAHLSSLHHKYNAEDTALITVESDRGIALINMTWGADKRFNSAKLVSAEGSIYYENGNTITRNCREKTETIPVPDASEKNYYPSLYSDMFNDFFTAIEKKKPDNIWIEEAYNSIKLMEACYKSSDQGRTITTI